MHIFSARQAIHDAYAINLRSRGFDVSHMAPVRKPDFSPRLFAINKRPPGNREQLLAAYKPVGYYCGDHVSGGDINAMICNTAEAGVIISAVESLEEPFQPWAIWAYGPHTQHYKTEQARFFSWLEQDINNNLEAINRRYRKAAIEKIRQVVAYTVLDYQAYLINGTRAYPASKIIRECRIQRQNWTRDFVRWNQYYWNLCDTWLDAMALRPVAKAISRLIGNRD